MKVANVRARIASASAPKSQNRTISFDDFTPDSNLNESQRAAQFLNWAADNMPKRSVPYTWVTKHAYIKTRVPRSTDPDVVTLRTRKMGQIKKVLWDIYSRRTVASTRNEDPGVRATVDSDDVAGTDFYRNKRRVASGIKRMADTRSKMDVDSIRDAGLKKMVENMDPIIKRLTNKDLLKQLELPPAQPDLDVDDE